MARQPVRLVEESTSAVFERLTRTSLADVSLEEALQTIVQLPTSVLSGPVQLSVTVVDRRGAGTPAATGRLARDADAAQIALGTGPCLLAAVSSSPVAVDDTRTDTRWGDYGRRAAALGARSSLSVPMPVGGDRPGALNVYATEPGALADVPVQRWTARYATAAAVLLANLHGWREAQARAEDLQTAMRSRATIEQAKGILMERFRTTDDRAFTMLSEASMRTNRKLRDVAAQLVQTGEWAGRGGTTG